MVDSHYLGYELSWEDSVLDVVDNFIHRVFQRTVVSNASWQFLQDPFNVVTRTVSITQIQVP